MIKPYVNMSIVLIASWFVYITCQNDPALPFSAGIVLLLTLFLRLKTSDKQFKFFGSLPLSAVMILSFILGLLWRAVTPDPYGGEAAPYPEVFAAIQSGSIIAAVLIWLKPFSKRNLYQLAFAAWVTVATSINIPVEHSNFLNFNIFFLLSTAIIFLGTMRRPKKRKHIFRYYKDFILYCAILIMLSQGLFLGISRTMIAFDDAFTHMMNDFITSNNFTHFLRIDSRLSLNPPGESAWDKRPVLEITVPSFRGAYLRTQVFETFDDGVWVEDENIEKYPLSRRLDDRLITSELTMFTSLKDIVPAPREVLAAEGNVTYLKSENENVYTTDKQRSRKLKLAMSPIKKPVVLSKEDFVKYTQVPPAIASELRNISSAIVEGASTPKEKANLLKAHFPENHEYSLSVNYKGDNEGIIDMIVEKRPAYCSYFATALTLLLRAEGIPARVVTGFATSEVIDKRSNKFLARVNNAHAWTEVLLPTTDPETGITESSWQTYDATPGSAISSPTTRRGFNFNRWTEKMSLSILRFIATMESMDKNLLKQRIILGLIFIILLINRKVVFEAILQLFRQIKFKKRRKLSTPSEFKSLYRQYESFLKKHFNETRRPFETDEDVLKRLNQRQDVPTPLITKAQSFLNEYHAARFGSNDVNADELLRTLN